MGLNFDIPDEQLQNIRIDGFVPVIINIQPLNNLPLFLGMDTLPDSTPTARVHTPQLSYFSRENF